MSTVTLPLAGPAASAPALLRLDGALCVAMGLPLAVAADPVATLVGTDATVVVRVVGIALVVYAVALAVSAGTRWARPALRAAAIGNIAWEAASLAVAALADLSTAGRVLVAAQGLAVGVLALVQLRAGRR